MSGAGEADRLDRSLDRLRTRFLGELPTSALAPAAVSQEPVQPVSAQTGRIGHLLDTIRLRWVGLRR